MQVFDSVNKVHLVLYTYDTGVNFFYGPAPVEKKRPLLEKFI